MKNAVQFGAGNIGRGFIGALMSESGYNVVFADVNADIINEINKAGQYTINIMDIECSKQTIKNVSGVLSTDDIILQKIKDAQIITTAVGPVVLAKIANTIARGIKLRKQTDSNEYLNIIACENLVNASSVLKEEVLKYLDDSEIKYLEKYIGFPNCSVDRIVPPFACENILDVACENFHEWNVEKNAFKGAIPNIDGMNLTSELTKYIERKLFTLNTGHAITAYLGYIKGYKTIDKGIADTKIYDIVKNAMIESGKALIAKYNFDYDAHMKYIDKIINRFKNPYLNDEVIRVGREPLRKLGGGDRLIKPMMTANSYNIESKNLIIGIAAAMHYSNTDDVQSVSMQEMINKNGIKDTILAISQSNIDEKILREIDIAYIDIKKLI